MMQNNVNHLVMLNVKLKLLVIILAHDAEPSAQDQK